jgi:hypothetical protein
MYLFIHENKIKLTDRLATLKKLLSFHFITTIHSFLNLSVSTSPTYFEILDTILAFAKLAISDIKYTVYVPSTTI